jgi:CheY-like chemotaxis protein
VTSNGSSIRKTILVVDDVAETRITTKWFLGNFGYSVVTASSAAEALAMFHPDMHDLVLTDNRMPGMTGVEMAHIIKLRSPTTPVLMHTGATPQDRSCIDVVIEKPAHLMTVVDEIARLLSNTTRQLEQN